MVAFDQSGAVRWSVPNEEPVIATADGGVIGKSGTRYDQSGRATDYMGDVGTYSWLGETYSIGTVHHRRAKVIDFGSSFAPFQGGTPSANRVYVQLNQVHVYIPFEIGADPTPYLTKQYAIDLYNDYNKDLNVKYNILPPYKGAKISMRPFAFGQATYDAFLNSLKTANRVVAYIGHIQSLTDINSPYKAGGLCFSGWYCLMPTALIGGQSAPGGITWIPQPGGFTPQSKLVFLGACGIESDFIAQWHYGPGQAIVVPVYYRTKQSIDLPDAAADLRLLMDRLFDLAHKPTWTVKQAVDDVNYYNRTFFNKTYYEWRVIGDGTITIFK